MIDLKHLRVLAEAATPQNIDIAEIQKDFAAGEATIECPCCQGEGRVEAEADYCNYDKTAIGVTFYGIGNAHGAAEAYFRAANPAAIIQLLDALERKDRMLRTVQGALLAANGLYLITHEAQDFNEAIEAITKELTP